MADGAKIPLWKQHQSEEIMKVVTGLRAGDLQPLARYLEGGGLPESPPEAIAIPGWVAREIVGMIKGGGWHWYKLALLSQKRGRTWDSDLQTRNERFEIGFFVETRVRELGGGSFESVLAEAQVKFSVGRDKAAKAVASVRKYLKDAEAVGVDGWQVLRDGYSDEIG